MRILIASWHRKIVGGVESYLQAVIPALLERGHELGLIHGYETPGGDTIDPVNDNLPRWCYEQLGIQALMKRVAEWKPDLVYTHGLDSPELESALLEDYPCVLFAHGYYGTCATGRKCQALPHPAPCSRRFSPMCLVLHYPRRCGGLHPATTWRNYRVQAQRNDLLRRFTSVLVASRHMYAELRNNGVDAARLHLVQLPSTNITPQAEAPARRLPQGRILMMGRLTDLKGGAYLMQAIPRAARKLNRTLRLIIAGTGSEEPTLRNLAGRLDIPVEFTGWVSGPRREEVIRNSDLLAFPSLWPEPFGLSGIEAACLGIPAVGYAVGGIPDWLIPGLSGELAPANPPTRDGLSDAIVRALGDSDHYHRLAVGAWEVSHQFSLEAHLDKLEGVLSTVAGQNLSAVTH